MGRLGSGQKIGPTSNSEAYRRTVNALPGGLSAVSESLVVTSV